MQTGMHGLRIIVQSERDPVYLESRIEAFLQYLQKMLDQMTPEEYVKHQQSLRMTLLEKVKNLGQEANRHWVNHFLFFNRVTLNHTIMIFSKMLEMLIFCSPFQSPV